MIEEVYRDIYRIPIPLPRNPLGTLNSYIIKGRERTLIIDTGMNRDECYAVASEGLRELNIDLSRADFFITHMHADHAGLAGRLVTPTSTVYASQEDGDTINRVHGVPWTKMIEAAVANGFTPEEAEKAIRNHPGNRFSAQRRFDFHIVRDNDLVPAGSYTLRCIHTPGHTSGHMCLYEPEHRLFFSGDHVLFDITPNISELSGLDDPLHKYLSSLDKVYNLEASIVLPGHRGFSMNLKRRIDELKAHHVARAAEVLAVLDGSSQTAYDIASLMTWDLTYQRWSEFPIMQKWFATGEALAHIRYLEVEGKLEREMDGGRVLFHLPR